MASDKILVSTAEMQTTIGKYEQARATMQQAFSALDEAKEHIDRCWDGPAKLIYTERWLNIATNIKRSNDAIDATINSLKNAITEYENGDETVLNLGNNINTGTTPPMF
ncbi:MAG: WXG100 family type VII secretion target [Clostridia bacterium]|nr:WXG100 family type VII secretion target [Clostridia bacterium]MBO4886248.1 WXG100 family type VII secretion target [Clostridia bacterium]MBR4443982.1 WXG100 family type VII secretion target [Clostridia bacterium]